MLFKTRSASVYGIEAHLVDVEVNLTAGGTNGEFHIVGLPDAAVRESRSRVIAAIRNNGFSFPYQNITVNLAPADIKKEGSAFDLPLAVGILGGVGLLKRQDLSDFLLVGELSLDGKLRPVRGVLSIAMLAREKKIPCLIVATANAREAAVVGGIEVHPMRTHHGSRGLPQRQHALPGRFTSSPTQTTEWSAATRRRLSRRPRTVPCQTRDRSRDGRRT